AEACERAAALRRADDAEVAYLADLLVGVGTLVAGKTTEALPLVQDVLSRADAFPEPRWLTWASVGAGAVGDLAREVELLRRAAAVARVSGAVDMLTIVLNATAVDGILAGRWAVAAEAAEGLRLAKEAGLRNVMCIYQAVIAWFAAVEGDEEICRTTAHEAVDAARAGDVGIAHSLAEWALAMLDLSGGRYDDAALRLAEMSSAPPGIGHPYASLVAAPDLVEACVRAGRAEEAHP